MKYLAALLISLSCTVVQAAHPYDSVCRVLTRTSGGSGTLIVNEPGQYAVVLSVKHVAPTPGEWVQCIWGQTKCDGLCWKVYDNSDICLLLVASPPGLRTVEVALPDPANEPFVLVGFPSYSKSSGYPYGRLHWQTGTFRGVGRNVRHSDTTIMWDRQFVLAAPDKDYAKVLDSLQFDTLFVNCAPWSGMSGGACFDQKGRVIGAVATAHPSIAHGTWGGVTSGQGLMCLTGVEYPGPTWLEQLWEVIK